PLVPGRRMNTVKIPALDFAECGQCLLIAGGGQRHFQHYRSAGNVFEEELCGNAGTPVVSFSHIGHIRRRLAVVEDCSRNRDRRSGSEINSLHAGPTGRKAISNQCTVIEDAGMGLCRCVPILMECEVEAYSRYTALGEGIAMQAAPCRSREVDVDPVV